MYVAKTSSNTVSVIDSSTNTVITTIRVGAAPTDIAFNPNNGNMYLANVGGGSGDTVSVIAPLTTSSSSGCNGTIDGGQAATCKLVNTFGK
jgi:YVTN family beta-propeller protein